MSVMPSWPTTRTSVPRSSVAPSLVRADHSSPTAYRVPRGVIVRRTLPSVPTGTGEADRPSRPMTYCGI